ncbi:MAG: adenylate/guanylate cyclase domain-containing protein [Rhodospirillales bacterium]|nr:adenylate/guanylate cyclase domain-containing protein [Rhodospirillales bacterium]
MKDAALADDPVAVQSPERSLNPLIAWLWETGWNIGSLPDLTRGLGHAMNAAGVPTFRLRLTLRTMHPQLAGLSHTWRRDTDEIEEFWPPLSVLQQDLFLKSPYALIFQGAGAVRRRLDLPDTAMDFPILEELKALSATDYVALPLVFGDGRISAVTIATDRPGGFSTHELQTISDAMPVLARLMETHALRRTARTVLETYLGRLTGERVWRGLIHRGEGEDIFAVIWFCDLRASTALADALPRRAYLDLLNDYFECMAEAVLGHGGEVLKFIGDAVLAIFPLGPVGAERTSEAGDDIACKAALTAARDAIGRMAILNARRADEGETPLRFGIGLHLGDVMYGNVGAPSRLDFTVIGAACNEAARLEAMCKVLSRPVIISADFANALAEPLTSLGFHGLRGIRQPHELFTLPEYA